MRNQPSVTGKSFSSTLYCVQLWTAATHCDYKLCSMSCHSMEVMPHCDYKLCSMSCHSMEVMPHCDYKLCSMSCHSMEVMPRTSTMYFISEARGAARAV